MDNLTPTAQAVIDALREEPGTATELRERTGRSRSTTDKALAELTRADLITKLPDDNTAAPARWTLTPSPASDSPELVVVDLVQPGEPVGDPSPASDAEPPEDAAAVEVKICRGCQVQIPMICPACWQKTPGYCGTCRKESPAARAANGDPQILPNGLRKLSRGELEHLVVGVMREHPIPEHVGITGWTPGRIAIFLPGRSTGAIGNALDKLATTGTTELIGDKPARYRLAPTDAQQQDDETTTEEHPPQ